MKVLGLSFGFHDSAAALIEDGAILCADQEERFTRRKHEPAFPANAAAFCLATAGTEAADLDAAVYYEDPITKLDRALKMGMSPWNFRPSTTAKVISRWARLDKFDPCGEISRHLDIARNKVFHTLHHESHAASAYFPSPFDEATVITLDGVGEWETANRCSRLHYFEESP